MPGIGTIVNVLAIIIGGALGLIIKKGIPERILATVMRTLGVVVIFIGISCTLAEMLIVGEDGTLSTQGTMMMIVSLVIGTIIGELLKIEERLEKLGDTIKKIPVFSGNSQFTDGFVTATLVVCVGAMAIVGSMRDGIQHDPTMLYSKSLLDFVSCMIFASSLGVGVLFAAVPLGIYQGLITVLSGVLSGVLTDVIVSNMSLVGSAMIFCVGLNLFGVKHVKVGSMLPGLIVAVIYGLIFP